MPKAPPLLCPELRQEQRNRGGEVQQQQQQQQQQLTSVSQLELVLEKETIVSTTYLLSLTN